MYLITLDLKERVRRSAVRMVFGRKHFVAMDGVNRLREVGATILEVVDVAFIHRHDWFQRMLSAHMAILRLMQILHTLTLLQNAVKVYVVQNLLSHQTVFGHLFVCKPDRDLTLRFIDRF